MMPNQMVLHIQPEEGISLRFAAKTPGTTMQLGEVNMDFNYEDYFGAKFRDWLRTPDAMTA